MESGDPAQHLLVEGTCPECGGPYAADLWDHSHRCAFCGSLLVLDRDLAQQLFAVSDGASDPSHALAIVIGQEAAAYRARLLAARSDDGLSFGVPAVVDARVEAYRGRLGRQLELLESVDFFVPYRISEQTVAQAILGRRRGGAKESYLQMFQSQTLERLYDADSWHLRDRGLKIHGFRLKPLDDGHLRIAAGRFLPTAEPGAGGGIAIDRTRTRIRPENQIVARIAGSWRGRTLTVYKHLTYACVRRAGRREDYLLDRQFETVAARLRPSEAEPYRALPARDLSGVLPRCEARAIASECPECGWEIRISPRERIAFCTSCRHGVRVGAKGLATVPYRVAAPPEDAERLLYFPFWSYRFRLRAAGREFRRIRDWLEAVSPEQRIAALAERDPAQSLLFIPARSVYGNRELDAAFELLTGFANWSQPRLARERPCPDDRARMLGVDVDSDEAAALARYALVALHDNASTRRLNGRSFRQLIAEAELRLDEPRLTLLPLAIRGDRWRPPGLTHSAPAGLLTLEAGLARTTLSHALGSRRRRSS